MFALLFMFLGMALGFLLRETVLPGALSRLVMPLIYALLFCMGVLIGANHLIMDNLPTLGLRGLALAAATLLGSVAVVALIVRVYPACMPGEHRKSWPSGPSDRAERDGRRQSS